MVVLVTWTETTILVNGVPTRRSSLRNEISSIRHSDDESYGCENHRVWSAIVIDVIVHCHTAGASTEYQPAVQALTDEICENHCV